jgi:hypothetical protein
MRRSYARSRPDAALKFERRFADTMLMDEIDSKPILMVDVDDTVYGFKALFARKALEIWGVDIKIDSQDAWACLFESMLIIDEQQGQEPGEAFRVTLDACFAASVIEDNTPHEGAAGVLRRLSRTYEIFYVTDRPESAAEATRAWLEAGAFPSTENLVCTTDKREWMDERKGQIASIIDDRPRTLIHALRFLGCEHVHALHNAWNSDLADVEDVYIARTWSEIGENIERLSHAGEQSKAA